MKAPRFLYSESISSCCKTRELLVRSRDGGFVSRNCLACGIPSYAKLDHLPILDCEFCGVQMKREELDGKNYFYKCYKCGRVWKLAEHLPHWLDLFERYGLPAPGDQSFKR